MNAPPGIPAQSLLPADVSVSRLSAVSAPTAGVPAPPARSSRIFDLVIFSIGCLVTALAVTQQMLDPGRDEPVYYLAIPVIMVMGWFPMLLGRTGGGIEIGLNICVLIFLGVMTDPWQSLTIWSIGDAVGQLLSDKKPLTKAFNSGLAVIAGGLALLAITLTRDGAAGTPRELLAAGLGTAVYFAIDFVVSSVSISIDEGTNLWRGLATTGAVGGLVAFLGIASLGYVSALVARQLPDWAFLLLAVPISTIVMASRAQSRGTEDSRRLKILLDAAVRVQTVHERPAVLQALRSGASDLLRDPRVELRPEPPKDNEIGVAVRGSGDDLWIVGPALNRARSTAEDDQQGLAALVAVAEDAFARLRLSDDMTHLAWHDPLTGLPNRSLFMDRVGHAIAMQGRRGGLLAVLFCDLDGFKRVNDLFGHAAGDSLLVEVGRRIRDCVRETDTVARLGGDEFAVLLEDVQHADHVGMTCERILEALRRRFEVAGEDVSVTTTIGVARSETGASAESLLSQADLAMYHAKGLGKNRYATYRLSFGDERLQRIELVETLRRAVEGKQLEVVYQPLVDLQSRTILGAEALVRWRRDGALVPPDLFIPTAEESGLIVGLGESVLEMVAADTPRLLAAAGRTLSMSVNISAQQLHEPEFAATVAAARTAMGDVDLILELTERDFVTNDSETLLAMTELARAGIRFAIDDFGVGFSSLGYLQRLPVDILKIDRSFLDHIEDDSRACSLVRSMVVMGEALGLEVVIEGVERQGQLEHVTDHAGGRIAQGYLFGRPMNAADLVTLLGQAPRARSGHPVSLSAVGD